MFGECPRVAELDAVAGTYIHEYLVRQPASLGKAGDDAIFPVLTVDVECLIEHPIEPFGDVNLCVWNHSSGPPGRTRPQRGQRAQMPSAHVA
jgi:hypothetical protein